MPRNGSSVYSLPAGNPVVPGTTISTTWANTTLTDIGTALTQSLSTDGSTAAVSLAGKTVSGGTYSGPTVTGVLTLTGGQVQFPAVQVPSADANCLDDYEEGTWTPTLTFATAGNLNVVYSVRTGSYTKVGNLVSLTQRLVTTTFTHTTAAGNAQITGVPFAAKAITSHIWGGSVSTLVGVTGVGGDNIVGINIATTDVLITFMSSNVNVGTNAALTTAFFPTAVQKEIVSTLTYQSA